MSPRNGRVVALRLENKDADKMGRPNMVRRTDTRRVCGIRTIEAHCQSGGDIDRTLGRAVAS